MSSRLLEAAWELDLDTTSKLLAVYLADNADRKGNLPSQSTDVLANMIARNNKTTLKALRVLEGAGLLKRDAEPWHLRLVALDFSPLFNEPEKEPDSAPHAHTETTADGPAKDSDRAATQGEEAPPAETAEPAVARLTDFCAAWGLTSPSAKLSDTWLALEKAEAKYNRKEKHSDGETKWTVEIESLAELMPQVIKAVEVFQARKEAGLAVHADSPVQFLEKQLWLAPDYHHMPDYEPPKEYTEAELDAMVMEMNRQGGPFATHLKMSSKNPHTGEIEVETLRVYQNRVLGKWDQYQMKVNHFRE